MGMFSLNRRRLILATITLFFFVLIVIIGMSLDSALIDSTFFSGWILIALMFGLVIFSVRKKISVLPLGSAYSWAQFHYYAGILFLLVFILHTSYSLPSGYFSSIFYLLVVLEIGSGFFGLFITRFLPRKMHTQSESVIFERIPGLRFQLQQEIQELAMQSVDQGGTAIRDFYLDKLITFMNRPRNRLYHLVGSRRIYVNWAKEFDALQRYVDQSNQDTLNDMRALVFQKIGLDNQYSNRLLLRAWLFFHIPVGVSLVVFVLTHTFIVYSFSG
jgi:hypothetical protein